MVGFLYVELEPLLESMFNSIMKDDFYKTEYGRKFKKIIDKNKGNILLFEPNKDKYLPISYLQSNIIDKLPDDWMSKVQTINNQYDMSNFIMNSFVNAFIDVDEPSYYAKEMPMTYIDKTMKSKSSITVWKKENKVKVNPPPQQPPIKQQSTIQSPQQSPPPQPQVNTMSKEERQRQMAQQTKWSIWVTVKPQQSRAQQQPVNYSHPLPKTWATADLFAWKKAVLKQKNDQYLRSIWEK